MTNVPQKLFKKNKNAKIYKFYNKSKISKDFLKFCGVTSVAK